MLGQVKLGQVRKGVKSLDFWILRFPGFRPTEKKASKAKPEKEYKRRRSNEWHGTVSE